MRENLLSESLTVVRMELDLKKQTQVCGCFIASLS
jgi:hypothetical protein